MRPHVAGGRDGAIASGQRRAADPSGTLRADYRTENVSPPTAEAGEAQPFRMGG